MRQTLFARWSSTFPVHPPPPLQNLSLKGLIFLEAKSAILHEQLKARVLEGRREPCDVSFADFDDVKFRVLCTAECPNIIKVSMFMRQAAELKAMGSKELLDRLFPGMEATPDQDYNVAIEFDCDRLPGDAAAFLESVCMLKRHVLSGPMHRAFSALVAKKSEGMPLMRIDYRRGESIFVCPSATKIVVIFLVDFVDVTDKALAKVFLQEFMEAQRSVRMAPPVSYSPKAPPSELAGLAMKHSPDAAGFLSFALEEIHVKGERLENALTLLTGFRNYLHYHIKCSKTYLHMRMRKRVAGWLQVLNRAIPERADSADKKTAQGKTFVRK